MDSAYIQRAIRDTRDHLDELQEAVRGSGGPCHACKYGRYGDYFGERTCKHPFVIRGSHDPRSGKTTWIFGDQNRMRENGGLCGAAGLLWERAALPLRIGRWLLWQKWPFFVAGVVTYFCVLIRIISS